MKYKHLLLLFIPIVSFGQKRDCQHVHTDSLQLAKTDLYQRAKIWVVKSFPDANKAIQMDDAATGTIICKGKILVAGAKNFIGKPAGNDFVTFTLTIITTDNKYKIDFDNLQHTAGSYEGARSGGSLCNDMPDGAGIEFSKKRWQKIKTDIASVITDLNSNFKKAVESNTDKF
jgi:Domain of unknown function (DUF4468) with TBP-like fold